MQFRIADTFTASLARLTGDEQKAVKTTAFDLQMNLAHPGLQFHKLNKARDRNFWSVRVNADVRLIVHRSEGSLLLCYVDHHDKAYDWAERRKLEVHPTTGAAQLVEIRETVRQIVVPMPIISQAAPTPKRALFVDRDDDELLAYGVPVDWLPDVKAADEDSILTLAERLPAEAAEALLQLATGKQPSLPIIGAHHLPADEDSLALIDDEVAFSKAAPDPFDHPDAQRRFRVMTNLDDLKQALDAPWDRWTVFLHPDQRRLVERQFTGPARVSGSAGTGKTIVALHRAAHLARTHADARILLATFSEPLANALRIRLRRLLGSSPRLAERIDVEALDVLGPRLYRAQIGPLRLVSATEAVGAIQRAAAEVPGHRFTQRFLETEWEQVVDAWQLNDWDGYRNVARLGRKTRLSEGQRRTLWAIFEQVLTELKSRGTMTLAGVFNALAAAAAGQRRPSYDHAVIDEAQDLTVAQLRFLQTFGAAGSNALFFAGDLGQRIFQQPFSWKSLGVDVRGRSTTLKVNYRTSHQIRRQADRLLGHTMADIDGVEENRRDTVSVFNGPEPAIHRFGDEQAEIAFVADWLRQKTATGTPAHEIAVFVRGIEQIARARRAVESSGLPYQVLDERVDAGSHRVSISSMHLAKGLEFRAVVVMACDDEVVPSQQRIDTLGDDADLQDVYETERHLLYVACTRARDELAITCIEPGSEFLDDLRHITGKAN